MSFLLYLCRIRLNPFFFLTPKKGHFLLPIITHFSSLFFYKNRNVLCFQSILKLSLCTLNIILSSLSSRENAPFTPLSVHCLPILSVHSARKAEARAWARFQPTADCTGRGVGGGNLLGKNDLDFPPPPPPTPRTHQWPVRPEMSS